MKSIKAGLVIAGMVGTLTGVSGVYADAALYTGKLCNTCHGLDAKTPIQPMYPKLAGQNSAYCQQQVRDIKSGVRANAQTAVMKPLVQTLADDEIVKICDYVAGLE